MAGNTYLMNVPIPDNEFDRVIDLSELDLDYTELGENLSELTKLATKVTGIRFSHINLIDSFTQWTVAFQGLEGSQMNREDSVCTYTITQEKDFEVMDLSQDLRFQNKDYVREGEKLRYYYGIPLKSENGNHIGALCVLDPDLKQLDPEKKELLKLIANEIVQRLQYLSLTKSLKEQVQNLTDMQRKICHDIRGPIGGMVGIADMIEQDVQDKNFDEIAEMITILKKGGESVLEMAEQVMNETTKREGPGENQISIQGFCQKLSELYQPQAHAKDINLSIETGEFSEHIYFSRAMLTQIIGNLISNSIKFTEPNGSVSAVLDISRNNKTTTELKVTVSDSGIGISEDKIADILSGSADSSGGTKGESGFGYGLKLVRYLVQKNNGSMTIESDHDLGTTFKLIIPI